MGATLSAAQIAYFVTGGTGLNGGVYGLQGMPITPHNAQIAVAVALAESGGVVDNKGGPNSDGSYDWGLWQINDKAHNVPANAKVAGGPNWALAYQISDRGTNWTPWTTYKNGKYLAFMPQAATGIAHPDGSYQDNHEIPNNPVSAAATLLPAALTDPQTWIRVGMGIAGLVLLGIVLASLVGTKALKAIPAGKVLGVMASAAKSTHTATKNAVKDSVRTVARK